MILKNTFYIVYQLFVDTGLQMYKQIPKYLQKTVPYTKQTNEYT